MIYIKINDAQYPASITGKMSDKDWDGRASKAIKLEMSYDEALSVFAEGVSWSIVQEFTEFEPKLDDEGNAIVDESGNPIMVEAVRVEEFDNSEYNVSGDITDHRDGTVTVKMGKLTDLEMALEMLLGGAE